MIAGAIVLSAIAIGVTAVTLPGCSSCHMHSDFATNTIARPHKDIACTRCHVLNDPASRISYASYEIFGMVLHVVPIQGRTAAAVPDSTCLSCHDAVERGTTLSRGLRIQHAQCAKKSNCTDCHSATAHGASVKWQRIAHMEQCLDCHGTNRVRESCNTCHATQQPQERLTSGPWYITHGPQWKTTHGMGDWKTCGSCHAVDYCSRCHHMNLPHDADWMRNHGQVALSQRTDCDVCHQEKFCSNCHQIEMPHPVSFAPAHPGIVNSKGEALCLKCHVRDDCENCHLKHVHPGGAIIPPKAGL